MASSSTSRTDVREWANSPKAPDGQLSVIAIGKEFKVWIDKVKDETMLWMETEGQYPGYPPNQLRRTTWYYARAKSDWIDDFGTQTMQWTEDEEGELWKGRAHARMCANLEQTLKKRQHDLDEQNVVENHKRLRAIRNTESKAPIIDPRSTEARNLGDDRRRLRRPDRYTGTHDDDGNRIGVDNSPLEEEEGPWINFPGRPRWNANNAQEP